MGDLRITFTGDEARAVQAYNKAIEKEVQLRLESEKSGQSHRKNSEDMISGIAKVGQELLGLQFGINTITGVFTRSFELWKASLDQVISKIHEFQDAMNQAMTRGDVTTGARKEIGEVGAIYGVRPAEAMQTYAALTAQTPQLAEQERLKLFGEVMEQRGSLPVSGDALAGAYGRMSRMFPGMAPNDIQNIVQFSATKSALGTEQGVAAVPDILNAARLANVDPKAATALSAWMTRQVGDQGVEAAKILMTKTMITSPEEQGSAKEELFASLGITAGMSFNERMNILSKAKLSPSDLTDIYGRGAAAQVQPFFAGYGDAQEFISRGVGEMGRGDMAAGAWGRMQRDPGFKQDLELKRVTAENDLLDLAKGDEYEKLELHKKRMDLDLKKMGAPRFYRSLAGQGYDLGGFFGVDPEAMEETYEFGGKAINAVKEQGLIQNPFEGSVAHQIVKALSDNTEATRSNSRVTSGQEAADMRNGSGNE